MPKHLFRKLLLLIALSIPCLISAGQRVLLNTYTNIYELTGPIGSCTFKDIGFPCQIANDFQSIALHKDTLYAVSMLSDLYQVDLNNPGSCTFLTNLSIPGSFTNFNNLVCDKNGILYAIDTYTRDLYRYDPHTGKMDILGAVQSPPGGDMVFYGNSLLYASWDSRIYTVDMQNPAASQVLMTTPGYLFYGLFALPSSDCHKNRLFGVTGSTAAQMPAQLIELDPVAKKVIGAVCQTTWYNILDAASSVEDGTTAQVTVDSLALQSPCQPGSTGSVQVFASNALDGVVNYTLDGAAANTNGQFTNIPIGDHAIHLENAYGCAVDTMVAISSGLSGMHSQVNDPVDCAHSDGSIRITGNSQFLPVSYSLNGGDAQFNPVFDHLPAGAYTLSMTDAGHCRKDTGILLSYQQILPIPGDVTVKDIHCDGQSGSIVLTLPGNVPASAFTASLNQDPVQAALSFPGLQEGIYTLHVYNTNGCKYDSVLTVARKSDPEPAMQAAIHDQFCFSPNGSLALSIAGPDAPYLTSFNGGAYTTDLRYEGLAPATYTMRIQNKNACSWDTAFTIRSYPKYPLTLNIDTVNPVCTKLNSGTAVIQVEGPQAPYSLTFNNATYPSGSLIDQLSNGNYSFPVTNQDGCIVDTAHIHLQLDILPQCSSVYLPNAFSPDGNGANDLFRVIRSSPYLKDITLRVYDRYGMIIFVSSDEKPGWDGTFHGIRQPADTYSWTVDYMDFENKRRSGRGTVILIR